MKKFTKRVIMNYSAQAAVGFTTGWALSKVVTPAAKLMNPAEKLCFGVIYGITLSWLASKTGNWINRAIPIEYDDDVPMINPEELMKPFSVEV